MTRRELVALGATGAVLAGCGPAVRALQVSADPGTGYKDPVAKPDEIRLLDRVHYGPSLSDLARLRELGREGWIAAQLRGDFDEPYALTFALHRLDALTAESYDLRDRPEGEVLEQLQSAALLRATLSPNGLRARLDEHWADRFNVYARKGLATYRLARYRDALGDSLGSFPAMVRATLTHPAMVAYLDGQTNVKEHPNENLARELLELHTLGVDGGYSQRDVMEVARCLTGWRIETGFLRRRGSILFDADRHDDGAKTVLGVAIPPGLGAKDVDAVLDILTPHPATARRCADGLVRRFLGHADPAWTARMATIYDRSRGSVRAMLEPLLLSRALLDAPPADKRPFEVVVSALRATGARTDGGSALLGHLAAMGHAPYEWPMPDGYPSEPEAWRGGSLPRWRFALELARNGIDGTEVPEPSLPELARLLGADSAHPALRHSPRDGAALLLMDPRFVQC